MAAGVSGLQPDAVRPEARQKQVLVLYSTRRDAQLPIVGDREIPKRLMAGLPQGLDYYSEFIDRGRFPQHAYQDAFRDYLRLKYANHKFDLVIAMDEVSLRFISTYRSTLFRGIPLVFCTRDPAVVRPPNSTGLVIEPNFVGTAQLAIALQPEMSHMFVVTGASDEDRALEQLARAQLRTMASRLDIHYLSGLSSAALEAALARLPSHSSVYYLLVNRDGAGEFFHPLDYLYRVVAASNAPVYCWVDSAMDRGIVGGSLKVQEAQGQAVAALGLRVLLGESADRIPVASPVLNVVQVDWRQLRRWQIDERRVPEGAVVRFRTPSIWDRYATYIVGTVTLLAAQSALIAGLLLQRSRRRRAEARSCDLGSRLLNAQERERARIARELHDDVSQQLALLSIDLELLAQDSAPGTHQLADDALRTTQVIARSIHELSHRLHPAKLLLIGLVPAIRGLLRELSQGDVSITFAHGDVPPALPPELTLCLFRIVQEALQNAIKHAGARTIAIRLNGGPDAMVLSIVDDGHGFDVNRAWGRGLGLISMGERVDAVMGSFEIDSAPGRGTRLTVTVPVNVAAKPGISLELLRDVV